MPSPSSATGESFTNAPVHFRRSVILALRCNQNARFEDYSQEGIFHGSRSSLTASPTSRPKSSSTLGLAPLASSAAISSEIFRPFTTGALMTATGLLSCSSMTSAPCRTFSKHGVEVPRQFSFGHVDLRHILHHTSSCSAWRPHVRSIRSLASRLKLERRNLPSRSQAPLASGMPSTSRIQWRRMPAE